MDQIPRQRRSSLSIELSPLIDCVFLLLIFFMLSSTLLSPAITLDLPDAGLSGEVRSPEILVTVTDEGRCLVNGTESSLESLSETFRPLLARSKNRVVTYQGDASSRHAVFVRVLDAARAAGARHVDVAHELPADAPGRP